VADGEHKATLSLFGVSIDALSMADTLGLVDRTVRDRGRLLIGVVNAAKMVNMRRDPALCDAMSKCDVTLADGIAVVWGLKLLGRRLPERIPGIDLMHAILNQGMSKKYRVFLFGARAEVIETVERKINEDYPGVVVAGRRNGYYKAEEERDIIEQIRAAKADVIFVAMSPPKKEILLATYREELGVPVMHGVGGAFDVMAGRVKRAPDIWQTLGMEWLYRVVQEPRRMWRRYLVTNTLFIALLLREMITLPFVGRPPSNVSPKPRP
jgi:exopolysaccharide biosynthesis WecB/TagA/CpsF family protein